MNNPRAAASHRVRRYRTVLYCTLPLPAIASLRREVAACATLVSERAECSHLLLYTREALEDQQSAVRVLYECTTRDDTTRQERLFDRSTRQTIDRLRLEPRIDTVYRSH